MKWLADSFFRQLYAPSTESAVQSFFGGHAVLDFDSRGCGQGMRKQLLIFLALFLAMRNGQKRLLTLSFIQFHVGNAVERWILCAHPILPSNRALFDASPLVCLCWHIRIRIALFRIHWPPSRFAAWNARVWQRKLNVRFWAVVPGLLAYEYLLLSLSFPLPSKAFIQTIHTYVLEQGTDGTRRGGALVAPHRYIHILSFSPLK